MIRAAAPSDIEAFQRVARETWRATYERMIPQDVQRQVLEGWYSAERLRESVLSRESVFLVVIRDQDVVAFSQFVLSHATAELTRLYVLPERQREGLGTALLEAGAARVRQRGCTRLEVSVERDNATGRAFYRRHGFREGALAAVDIFGHAVPIVQCERILNTWKEGE
jgi:ribosomal protein S18 acetylase RimI-like enzyme